jgi:hypothetical protein
MAKLYAPKVVNVAIRVERNALVSLLLEPNVVGKIAAYHAFLLELAICR